MVSSIAVLVHLTGDRVEFLAQLHPAQNERPPEAESLLRPGDGCGNLLGLPVVFRQELVEVLSPRRYLVFSRRRGARIPGGDCFPEFLGELDSLW